MAERRAADGFFPLYLWVLIVVLVGWLLEGMVRRKTAGTYQKYRNLEHLSGLSKVGNIGKRILLELAYLGVFIVATSIFTLLLYRQSGTPQLLAMHVLSVIVMIKILNLGAKVMFSPKSTVLRFFDIDNNTSRFLYRWTLAIGVFWIIMVKILFFFQVLGGSEQGALFLRSTLAIVLVAMLATMGWKHRQQLLRGGRPIKGSDEQEKSLLNSKYTPALCLIWVIYVFFLWIFAFVGILTGEEHVRAKAILSIMIGPLYVLLDMLGLQLLDMIFSKKITSKQKVISAEDPLEGEEVEEEETETSTGISNYYRASRKVFRAILIILTVGFFLRLWGIEGPLFQEVVLKAFFNTLVTIILAYFLWMYVKSYIEKKLGIDEESEDDGFADEMGGGGGRDRSYTLLPLIQKFIGVVLFVTVSLIVLSSIGVEIGPLLASAGIFGLAIGLGSQTLVRDVVAGIFFIMDDAFRVGDYVTVGGQQGTIMKTSLRTMTIRHYKGQMQILTYGDISSVTNWSRGPMLVKFSLRLPADTNAKKVKKIIKKINAQMMEEEQYGPKLVEPIKSQGVKTIEDGVMTIRVKFRALSGTQFTIKREAFRRIHAALSEKGIKFASRGVTVNVPPELMAQNEAEKQAEGATNSTSPAPEVIATTGAAAGAILEEPGKKKKK
jgi:small-conductance mechanosensitive channel